MIAKWMAALVASAIGIGAFVTGIQEQQELQQDAKPFMQRKLDSSRAILEGLAMEDFRKIGDHAQKLALLSYEADWNVIQTEPYLKLNSEFRGSTQRLRDSADDQNIDAATLAWFEVTLNCVRCHKYIRARAGED